MHIELTEAETEILQRLLGSEVRDLSYQIADTDTSTFRDELRQYRDNVKSLLDKVGGPLEDEADRT